VEEIVHKGKIAWEGDYNFPMESDHQLLGIRNRDHSSPGLVARFLRKILPNSWMENIGVGKVHSEIKLDPSTDLDLEEGDEVEVVVRNVESV
jgi:hypothetical protein